MNQAGISIYAQGAISSNYTFQISLRPSYLAVGLLMPLFRPHERVLLSKKKPSMTSEDPTEFSSSSSNEDRFVSVYNPHDQTSRQKLPRKKSKKGVSLTQHLKKSSNRRRKASSSTSSLPGARESYGSSRRVEKCLDDFEDIMNMSDDESPAIKRWQTRPRLNQGYRFGSQLNLKEIFEEFPDSEHQRTGKAQITGWE